MKTKKEKFSSWVKNHSFEITAVSFYVAATIGLGYLAVKQADAIAEEQQKLEDWENEQITNGNTIIEKDDHLMAVKVVSIY